MSLLFHRSSPLRLAIVSRFHPFTNDGAGLYVRSLCRVLKGQGYDIHYICLGPSQQAVTRLSGLDLLASCNILDSFRVGCLMIQPRLLLPALMFFCLKLGKRCLPQFIVMFLKKSRAWRSVTSHGAGSEPRGSPWTSRLSTPEAEFVRRAYHSVRPHVMVSNYVYLADALTAVGDDAVCKVIFAHDVRHLREAALARFGSYESFPAWTREEEAKALAVADVVVAIQSDDAECFKQLIDPAKVVCVPLPVQIKPRTRRAVPGRCLYVGSSHTQSISGLRWFLDEVWPLVIAGNPVASLEVCGSVCDVLSSVPQGVILSGFVPNLTTSYYNAQLVVVPLAVGSGLKIKLMDAWSHGLPVVSTSVGLQGVKDMALSYEAAILADSPEDFAGAVRRVLDDADMTARMEAGVSRLVQTQFSDDECCRVWLSAMCAILEKRGMIPL